MFRCQVKKSLSWLISCVKHLQAILHGKPATLYRARCRLFFRRKLQFSSKTRIFKSNFVSVKSFWTHGVKRPWEKNRNTINQSHDSQVHNAKNVDFHVALVMFSCRTYRLENVIVDFFKGIWIRNSEMTRTPLKPRIKRWVILKQIKCSEKLDKAVAFYKLKLFNFMWIFIWAFSGAKGLRLRPT